MVEIINHVTDPRTDEGEGSIKIAQSFKDYFTNRPDIDGRIDIFPSVIAFGQKGNVKDVDLFLICEYPQYPFYRNQIHYSIPLLALISDLHWLLQK